MFDGDGFPTIGPPLGLDAGEPGQALAQDFGLHAHGQRRTRAELVFDDAVQGGGEPGVQGFVVC